jgi:hypothetical protein
VVEEGIGEQFADEGERITEGIVYRAGVSNPSNMTPRPKDADGPHRGLSTHVEPAKALPPEDPGEEGKQYVVVEIDVSRLTNLHAYRDSTGHVSLRPLRQHELEEWILSRGGADVHALTKEVRDAVVGKRKIAR